MSDKELENLLIQAREVIDRAEGGTVQESLLYLLLRAQVIALAAIAEEVRAIAYTFISANR